MGENLAERRPFPRRERDQQRALKPPAVLIAAFEIQVCRPAQLRRAGEYGFVARSRIEPDIEDIALALEGGAAA